MEKSLKEKYFWKVQGFVALNFILFASVIVGIHFDQILANEINFDFFKSLSPALISLLVTLVLVGIIPSNIKANIVFHRIKNSLPGCRVFTYLAPKDYRINIDKIEEDYGELPTDPKQQNQLWFSIYKNLRDEVTIKKSHYDFLLTRDLTAVSFIILVCFSVALLFFESSVNLKWGYFIYLLIQFFLLKTVALNYGNRFACNVLAEVS